ncbi:MAG: ATP-binding protein, partial [Pirellulaceae bacterium]
TPLAPEEVPLFRALHGEHVQNVEIVMARQDGPKRTLLTSGQAFFDEQGKKLGAVVSFQDITEQKRAVEELREAHQELEHRVAERTAELAQANESLRDADRRKDEFLAMLAHELRNPLTPIRTGLDLLAMEEDVGNRESVGLMQQQIEHVVRLVDDLLDVSRIIRGRIDLHRSPTLLSSIIHRSVETMRPLAESHQQELVVSVPDDPIYIDADSVRVVQVIENLLHNATKYTNVGGRIELVVEQQGSAATITIRDTGTGIDAELLPRVFELFSQSDRSLDRAEGGLGIGLTLVKQLVEMHGGTVSAQSDGAGCGSTFTIRLPIVEAVTQTDQKMERSLVAMNRRILVVDDNEGAAWMVSRLLQKLGNHQIETAHDGPAALEKIEETRPEIILLDIGLPEMDGYEVGAAVRKMPELADVLLIAMTGYGQEEDRRKSREVGFDEHLTKPPSIDQMRMVLSHPKLAIRAERR